jgi:hypothetical protein
VCSQLGASRRAVGDELTWPQLADFARNNFTLRPRVSQSADRPALTPMWAALTTVMTKIQVRGISSEKKVAVGGSSPTATQEGRHDRGSQRV